MGKLLVRRLHPDAKLPTVAHPGEDLGYDIYALEDTFLEPHKPTIVKTGIAAVYTEAPPERLPLTIGLSGGNFANAKRFGLEIKDRSSMAAKNHIHTLAGVIDAGYRSEIGVVMVLLGDPKHFSKNTLTVAANLSLDELVAATELRVKELVQSLRLRFGACYPGAEGLGYQIKAGDKIAQMLPREVLGYDVEEVETLPDGFRGDNGYGSSGN
jgi:dUTP pyrophosphatase